MYHAKLGDEWAQAHNTFCARKDFEREFIMISL